MVPLSLLQATLLHLLVVSGTSIAERLVFTPVHSRKVEVPVQRLSFSDSVVDLEHEATGGSIPVVNPTDPGSGAPATPTPPAPEADPITPTMGPPTPQTAPMGPPTPQVEPMGPPTIPQGGQLGPPSTSGGMGPPLPPVGGGMEPPTPPVGGGMGPPTTPDTGGGSAGGQWCVASPNASPTVLQVALDFACGYGGADCSSIQAGQSCYEPNTVKDHASYAFNSYYQKHPGANSCVFGGAAQLTSKDPSTGNCHYSSSSSASSTSSSPPTSFSPPSPDFTSPTTTPPDFSSPTTTPPSMTTPTTSIPGGPTVYGAAEPTENPSSARCFSQSFLSLFAAGSLLVPLLCGKYI